MNINVSIERLILDGLPLDRTHGAFVQGSVETELARLLAEGGFDHLSGGALPSLPINAIHLTADSKPSEIGHQIARAIHNSLAPAPPEMHFPNGPKR